MDYIKIEDGLPEPDIKVICVLKNNKGEYSYIMNSMYIWNGNKCWKGSKMMTDTIVAWKYIDEYNG